MVEAPEKIWPERLTLRDSEVYADEGQRIFTTATGYGYKKQEYTRSDIAERQIAELRAERDEAQSLADWYHRTNNEGIEAIWAVLGREPYREDGENLLGRVTELKARADALAQEVERLKAEIETYRTAFDGIEPSPRIAALEAEVGRLKKQIAAASTWFWPEGDTSSEACRDCPREVFEDAPSGNIAPYSCGGVVYTGWYGWLPAADDSDSDDEFEVDEPTEELAQAKMQAEIDRRAALANEEAGR